MLYEAITNSLIRHRFHLDKGSLLAKAIKRLSIGYVERLNRLDETAFVVCKTHDIYRYPLPEGYKCIFIYGDPLESAMSVEKVVAREGSAWFRLHQYHLNAEGAFEDLYRRDVLNYQGQLESWLSQSGNSSVVCVDYEQLWDRTHELSEFLDFTLQLPERRAREPKRQTIEMDESLFNRLRNLKNALQSNYEGSRH